MYACTERVVTRENRDYLNNRDKSLKLMENMFISTKPINDKPVGVWFVAACLLGQFTYDNAFDY